MSIKGDSIFVVLSVLALAEIRVEAAERRTNSVGRMAEHEKVVRMVGGCWGDYESETDPAVYGFALAQDHLYGQSEENNPLSFCYIRACKLRSTR